MSEEQFKNQSTNKLFVRLVIPNMISMLFISIYTIIDGIFVGRYIGSDALAAVNFVMPFIMITFALGDLLAIGSSVKISIALGKGEYEYANKAFTTILTIIVSLAFVMSIIGTFSANYILPRFIHDTDLLYYAIEYMKVMVFMMPLIMPLFAVDNYLRVCGKPNYSMMISIVAAVLNIILDYVFIVKLDLGIKSAALATTIGMSIASIAGVTPFILNKMTLKFTKQFISFKEVKDIAYNGSSEFFNNISGAFMSIIVNGLLLKLGGAIAVAIYGMIMYVDSMVISLMYGMLDAMQPAIGYNVGAKNIKKTKEILIRLAIIGSTLSIGFMIFIILNPKLMVELFLDKITIEEAEIARTAILLFSPTYLFIWFNMISSSFLTSIDRPKESLIIMLFRSVIFPIITLLITTNLFKVNGVYMTPPIASFLTMILAIFIWMRIKKDIFESDKK